MVIDGLSIRRRELSISHLKCGVLFSHLSGKCSAIEVEKCPILAVFKARNLQGNVFIFKASKWGGYCSTKSKNQHFLKEGI